MSIFVKPLDRIRSLEIENARLRALVGEPVEQHEQPDQLEQETPETLIQTTDGLKIAVGLMAEALL